jgi:diguanylate cyclase (GGDEF)-like protein
VEYATYYYAPFIMAAGIGFFPLTLMESGIILTQLLLVAAITGLADTAHASFFSSIAHVWLLFLVGIVGAFSAMSQLQFHAQTIEKSARDILTGLITRGVGTEILGSQIQMARRKRVPLTVLFVDLDHFKQVNDAFGHDCGDSVLATAARQLRTNFRKQDVLIRWGGEEFLIVCPETDEAHAIAAIERLTELGLGCLPDGSPQTASIGIAELDLSNPSSDPITLVASADRRMYQAKQAGRNRIAMSNGEMRGFLKPRHGEPSTHGAKRILAE